MSLLEVVVYCSLLSIFSLMLFLTLPVRDAGSHMAMQEASNEGTAALRLISRELANTTLSKLAINQKKNEVSFLSAVPDRGGPFVYDAQGALQWTAWLTYAEANRSLVKYRRPFSKPVASPAVPSITQMQTAPAEVVVRALSAFSVWEEPAGCCNLRLTLAVEDSQVEVRTAVTVRNP